MLDLETKNATVQSLKEVIEKLQQIRGDIGPEAYLNEAIQDLRKTILVVQKMETT
jgi:hypothetical protein